MSVKCFDGTTDEVLMDALEATIEHKGGMPAFYNDKAFIKILREMGVAEEDLVDWCPDGCIEASIPGKWDFAAKGPWLSIEKVLEITLNNGKTRQQELCLENQTKILWQAHLWKISLKNIKRL